MAKGQNILTLFLDMSKLMPKCYKTSKNVGFPVALNPVHY